MTSTRRAPGPRGAQPLLPARGDQADPGHQRAGRCARGGRARGSPAGSACSNARPGAARAPGSGSGSRPGPWRGWCAPIAAESGTTRLAVRVRPTSDPHQIVVAFPWRHRERAQAMGARRRGRCSTRCPSADVEDGGRARPPSGWSPPRRAARPDTPSRPRVPVVAVTGTNGKTTTSPDDRAHRPHRRQARRLVEHRRHLHRRRAGRGRRLLRPERRRPRAGPPGGRARGHRDRPRRHPAQGHRADPQRRLGRHQRLRRPPRPAGHRHRSTSSPR